MKTSNATRSCSVEGCEKASRTKGFCDMHYARLRRHGTTRPRPKRKCSTEGCEQPHKSKGLCARHYNIWRTDTAPKCSIKECTGTLHGYGWCSTHYQRWIAHGDPLAHVKEYFYDPEDAFAALTRWEGGCLVWDGHVDAKGYGRLKRKGTPYLAHRYAWERINGPIPSGKYIDHACHNTRCVNVNHLRPCIQSQNAANRRGAVTGSASGIRNVYPRGDKWFVQMSKGGTNYYFGTYDNPVKASQVAETARKTLFGEFAGKG